MAREIVYSETRPGIFEPKPTRAQKRAAERRKEERSERIKAIAMVVFIGLSYVLVFGAFLAPLSFWGIE